MRRVRWCRVRRYWSSGRWRSRTRSRTGAHTSGISPWPAHGGLLKLDWCWCKKIHYSMIMIPGCMPPRRWRRCSSWPTCRGRRRGARPSACGRGPSGTPPRPSGCRGSACWCLAGRCRHNQSELRRPLSNCPPITAHLWVHRRPIFSESSIPMRLPGPSTSPSRNRFRKVFPPMLDTLITIWCKNI